MSDTDDLYPCTVWSARYAGWYAMPCEPERVNPGFEGDTEDWDELREEIRRLGKPFGQGWSAAEALDDLARQLKADPDWMTRPPGHPGIV